MELLEQAGLQKMQYLMLRKKKKKKKKKKLKKKKLTRKVASKLK